MAETVRERRREIPALGGLLGRVGRGHDGYCIGQLQVAHGPFEHDAQERRLYRGRRGRDLVEERDPPAGAREVDCPAWRREVDAGFVRFAAGDNR